jgi:hypothetical protein
MVPPVATADRQPPPSEHEGLAGEEELRRAKAIDVGAVLLDGLLLVRDGPHLRILGPHHPPLAASVGEELDVLDGAHGVVAVDLLETPSSDARDFRQLGREASTGPSPRCVYPPRFAHRGAGVTAPSKTQVAVRDETLAHAMRARLLPA